MPYHFEAAFLQSRIIEDVERRIVKFAWEHVMFLQCFSYQTCIMEWLMMSHSSFLSPCCTLGWFEGSEFVTSDECLASLKAMECELLQEELLSRNVRLSFGLSHVVQKDLIPILIHEHHNKDVLKVVLRLLVNLTLPVECLIPVNTASKTPFGKNTLTQLYHCLLEGKKAFLDVCSTAAVIKSIKDTLKREKEDFLEESDCSYVNNCLLLLMNILHIPEKVDIVSYGIDDSIFLELHSVQNKLVWNLFVQGLDETLLLLVNNKHKEAWTLAIVQLIALLYKDQYVSKIQQLLTLVSSGSESSGEETESDTSKNSSTNLSSDSSAKKPSHIYNSDSGFIQTSDTCSSQSCSSSPANKKTLSKWDSNKCHEEKIKPTEFSQNEQDDLVSHVNKSTLKSVSRCLPNLTAKEEQVEKMDSSSSGFFNDFLSSDEENKDETSQCIQANEYHREGHTKSSAKHRIVHSFLKEAESDSSNEDESVVPTKQRSHPPIGRKGKSNNSVYGVKCSPSVCFEAALAATASKGKSSLRDLVWDKRKDVRILHDGSTHGPSDDDISNLLKDFTISFLHSGFNNLILDLMKVLLKQNGPILDKSHLLWLLSYFLRLATTLSLGLHHISSILSVEIIGYLTFEGVSMCEELQLLYKSQQIDLRPLLRRMHLLVTALREMIFTVDCYCHKPIPRREKLVFQNLRGKLVRMKDLRQLFLLLIRNYSHDVHTKQYLADVITTNHSLFLLLDRAVNDEDIHEKFDLLDHLHQFTTGKVMERYGKVLEDFRTNSNYVNDCVLTMMHHVAGDLKSPESLFNPVILKSFSQIIEEEWDICEYQSDVIGYVMNKFVRTAQRKPQICLRYFFHHNLGEREQSSDEESDGSSVSSDCSKSSNDDALYWWYLQFEQDPDPVGSIVEHCTERDIPCSREQILWQLYCKGIVSHNIYDVLKEKEKKYGDQHDNYSNSIDILVKEISNVDDGSNTDEIKQHVANLCQAGLNQHILWLQNLLLDSCYVKLALWRNNLHDIEYPVPLYSMLLKQSILIVPYNEAQELVLHCDLFVQLLHKLGFHLPADAGRAYPRIPCFWTADVLFSVATKLGPVDPGGIKFINDNLEDYIRELHSSEFVHQSSVPEVPLPPFIHQSFGKPRTSKVLNKKAELEILAKPKQAVFTLLETNHVLVSL
ncbi:protein timeless-like [Limulus polyphemus]|uniref:Protein timeless-like n=1 Tax=Limulus polyphemus TaxID=6850 RepID=A0ABM1SXE3_LIMPO|nr:protein timeless-like [Limulus polyphemus]